jgi:hypothetical protein
MEGCRAVTGLRQYSNNCWFAVTLFALFYTHDAFEVFSKYFLFRDDIKDHRIRNISKCLVKLVAGMLREDANFFTKDELMKMKRSARRLHNYLTDENNKILDRISDLIGSDNYTPRYKKFTETGNVVKFLEFLFSLFDVPQPLYRFMAENNTVEYAWLVYDFYDYKNKSIQSIIRDLNFEVSSGADYIIFNSNNSEDIEPNFSINVKIFDDNLNTEFFLNAIVCADESHYVCYVVCNGNLYLMDSENAVEGYPIIDMGRYRMRYHIPDRYNIYTSNPKYFLMYLYVKPVRSEVPQYFKCLTCTDTKTCNACSIPTSVKDKLKEGPGIDGKGTSFVERLYELNKIVAKRREEYVEKEKVAEKLFEAQLNKQQNPVEPSKSMTQIRSANMKITYSTALIAGIERSFENLDAIEPKQISQYYMIEEQQAKDRQDPLDYIRKNYGDISLLATRINSDGSHTYFIRIDSPNVQLVNNPDLPFKITFLLYGAKPDLFAGYPPEHISYQDLENISHYDNIIKLNKRIYDKIKKQVGGHGGYYHKYIKYKRKYLQLKL